MTEDYTTLTIYKYRAIYVDKTLLLTEYILQKCSWKNGKFATDADNTGALGNFLVLRFFSTYDNPKVHDLEHDRDRKSVV